MVVADALNLKPLTQIEAFLAGCMTGACTCTNSGRVSMQELTNLIDLVAVLVRHGLVAPLSILTRRFRVTEIGRDRELRSKERPRGGLQGSTRQVLDAVLEAGPGRASKLANQFLESVVGVMEKYI